MHGEDKMSKIKIQHIYNSCLYLFCTKLQGTVNMDFIMKDEKGRDKKTLIKVE